MAEGGKRQRSFKDSFSEADEVFCDACKSVGTSITVEGYCQICKEYLCETCLGVHRKQTLSRAHAIFEKKQMPRRHGSVSNQDICVEVCKTHHPEIIRFYCQDHDVPGCGDCMTLKHISCKIDRVQDISNGFKKTKEFKDIDEKLQQLHQELEEMEDVVDYSLKNLDTTYSNILRKITSVRKQINEYLDQMQKTITDEAAQLKKEDETELQNAHAEHQAMKAELKAMLQTIHDSNVNVSSLFVITKQAKQRLVTLEIEINQIKQQQQLHSIHIPNVSKNIFSTKTPLGKFVRKSTQKITITKEPDQRTSRKPTMDAKAKHNRRINVKGEFDFENCFITDCTLLSPDILVVIDKNNSNVKLIDIRNSKVISSYRTLTPDKVTSLSTSGIAVTLRGECKIQLFDVTATLTLQREIEISNICDGIAYKDGKLAIIYGRSGKVEILDIQGKILLTIQPKKGKDYISQHIFLTARYNIAFGKDNDTVVVSDGNTNTVSVVTFRGQILRTYTHDTVIAPQSIVITADGGLFVCSWENGCIHVVSPDFKSSKIIIDKQNRVRHPVSITYCDINHSLYISNTDSPGYLDNRIQVYDLNV